MPNPTRSADKIAAMAHTTEAPQDWRLRNGSPGEHRKADLRDALRRLGLPVDDADASILARVLNLAPSTGNVDEDAKEIAAQNPELFTARPKPSASRLVEQFRSGATSVTPGS